MEDEMNKVKLPVAGTGISVKTAPVNTAPINTMPANTTPANTMPVNTPQQAKSILTAATGIAGKSGIITAIETSELKPELKPNLDLKLKAEPKPEFKTEPKLEPELKPKAEPKLEQPRAEPELKTRIHKIFPFQTLIFAICLICFIIFFYYSR